MMADLELRLPPNISLLLQDKNNYYMIFTTTWLDNSISVIKLVSTSVYSYPKENSQSLHCQIKTSSDWTMLQYDIPLMIVKASIHLLLHFVRAFVRLFWGCLSACTAVGFASDCPFT